ncbi:MAG: radical SAM protein [Candidatus Brocadiaceae bacterium]|nr:radical SAM protein [Candidatus Brocadiaceae bacterium]OQZ04905.1 MAG: hypothetical protein B6D34_01350 [Candidatus Brocadia sp. UTAMX1]
MSTNLRYLIKGIVGRTFYVFPQQPERIQIEITNRCNYVCHMCPRESFNLAEKDIPPDLFKKIIDRIETAHNIILTGWGEPLLHPELMNMILYAKSKGHHVGVTTNGLLLAPFIEKLVDTVDKLTVSLDSIEEYPEVTDGHPSNNVVQKNIKSFLQRRGTMRKPVFTIQITMHNKLQCLATIKFAGEVGADRVYLVRLNNPLRNSSFKRPDLKEELEIYKEAEKIAGEYGLQVDNNYTAFENKLLRFFYKQLRPVMYRFDTCCPKPYDYLYVNIDGKATPCCDLPRYEVGNLLNQSIGEIWNGENMRYFREHQNDVCGACDALRLKHIQ